MIVIYRWNNKAELFSWYDDIIIIALIIIIIYHQ